MAVNVNGYHFHKTGRRKRPVTPGASIGHANTRGGTLGAVVRDRKSGEILMLSNNHVLANCSNGRDGLAEVGDPVFQPSLTDGGRYTDIVGRLYRFVPLYLEQPNIVDAAVARFLSPALADGRMKGIGRIAGVASGKKGMKIKKLGKATGVTLGEIIEEGFSVKIYFQGREYLFCDQLLARIPCKGGDSGSIVLDSDNRAVGLLFAAQGELGIINRIEHVIELLDIDIVF